MTLLLCETYYYQIYGSTLHNRCQSVYQYRTVLMLLKMVIEYCQLASDIPSVSPEILNRLIELLKVWFCIVLHMCKDYSVFDFVLMVSVCECI